MEVLLKLLNVSFKILVVNLSLPIGRNFFQKLWQIQDSTIGLAKQSFENH